MVSEIINGIAIALKAYPDAKVYDETVKQGLEVPCFVIGITEAYANKKLHGHYKVTQPFTVNYICDDVKALREVATTLPLALETIKVGNIDLHGTHITVAVDEESKTVNCTVNYDHTFVVNKEKVYMQAIDYAGGTK